MIRRIVVTIAMVGLCGAVVMRSAIAAEPAGQALIDLERAWSAAFFRHDVAAVGKILADDYVGVDGRGVVSNKADELAEVAAPEKGAPPPVFQILEESLSDFQVRFFDKVAVVNALNTVQAVFRGNPRTVRYRRTTVWQRDGSSWKCVAFHASEVLQPAS
jgi:ketosteroid isomerase-like protein